MGVFATRSPHRPCPIGLSRARVLGVQVGPFSFRALPSLLGSNGSLQRPFTCSALRFVFVGQFPDPRRPVACLPMQDGCLLLGGVDVVHNSPIFDVKPYVPFCDCLPEATAPDWVQVRWRYWVG